MNAVSREYLEPILTLLVEYFGDDPARAIVRETERRMPRLAPLRQWGRTVVAVAKEQHGPELSADVWAEIDALVERHAPTPLPFPAPTSDRRN